MPQRQTYLNSCSCRVRTVWTFPELWKALAIRSHSHLVLCILQKTKNETNPDYFTANQLSLLSALLPEAAWWAGCGAWGLCRGPPAWVLRTLYGVYSHLRAEVRHHSLPWDRDDLEGIVPPPVHCSPGPVTQGPGPEVTSHYEVSTWRLVPEVSVGGGAGRAYSRKLLRKTVPSGGFHPHLWAGKTQALSNHRPRVRVHFWAVLTGPGRRGAGKHHLWACLGVPQWACLRGDSV